MYFHLLYELETIADKSYSYETLRQTVLIFVTMKPNRTGATMFALLAKKQ